MRALKLLVIVMGVFLVAGIVALAIAVQYRINHPRPTLAAPSSGKFESAVALPPGAKVIGTKIAGDRLVVRVALAEGGEEEVIINLANGAIVATVLLQPKPVAP